MSRLLFALVATLFLGSCAMTSQHVRTMDGDEFSQVGGALFSKQRYVHGLHAEFLPNNSGAIIDVKGEGDQDSTALVPVIQAAITAAIRAYTDSVSARPPPLAPIPSTPAINIEVPRDASVADHR